MNATRIVVGVLATSLLSLGCGPDLEGFDPSSEAGEIELGEAGEAGEEFEIDQAAACTTGGYTAYPSGIGTFTTTSAAFPWTENFERYANGELVECSSNRARRSHLDATSGCLYGKHVYGTSVYKRGWATTYNFRAVAFPLSSGRRARYTATTTSARFNVNAIQPSTSVKQGVNLFARYTNADNLYVAALKTDGYIFIASKVNCNYRTLAKGSYPFKKGAWHQLKLKVVRQADGRDRLDFYIDNMSAPVLTGYSGTNNGVNEANHLRSGTVGIRTDYVNVYVDDWKAF